MSEGTNEGGGSGRTNRGESERETGNGSWERHLSYYRKDGGLGTQYKGYRCRKADERETRRKGDKRTEVKRRERGGRSFRRSIESEITWGRPVGWGAR